MADGSTPASQAAPASSAAPSTHDRLKSALFPAPASNGETQQKADSAATASNGETQQDVAPAAHQQVPAQAEEAQTDQADAVDDVQSDDAQSEDWQPSTIEELAEGLQWEQDKLLSMPVKVKVDGKEGTATLRDLVKSYQLDSHINQKLASFDADRKAFESKVQHFDGERADKLLRLDAGLQTMNRLLLGEFQSVDWQKLAAEDPADYNARLVSFQQRNAELQDMAAQINAEKEQAQQRMQLQHQAAMAEQLKLLRAKAPEFGDEAKTAATKADVLGYFADVGYGKEEAEGLWGGLADHRLMLMALDAARWSKLQKSKPAQLNKVKAAPKLVKPGTKQSRDASVNFIAGKERERLKQTGKVTDAKPVLKRLLFGG